MLLFFVGTGFSENHDSNTIYLAAYDSNSVSIVSSIKVDAGNPSALISHTAPNEDNRLYFVDETLNGTVHSLKYSLVIDTTASIPTYEIDAQIISPPQSSVGRHPCYLSFDRARKVVFVANYSEGSTAVLPLTSPSGCLQASTDDKTHQYDKKNFINFQDRQEHAHCHCVEVRQEAGSEHPLLPLLSLLSLLSLLPLLALLASHTVSHPASGFHLISAITVQQVDPSV